MPVNLLRRAAGAMLLCGGLLLGSCDGSSGGVGFSVDLPPNFGSMEMGTPTTQWVGSPFW
jgi:hypothetical protein